jgi:hypothetical protein
MHSLPDRVIVTPEELLISWVHKPLASAFDAATETAFAGSGDRRATDSNDAVKVVLSFINPTFLGYLYR